LPARTSAVGDFATPELRSILEPRERRSDYTNIDSFTIGSNGALQQVSTINASQYNPYNSGGPGNLFLDHTGTSLYDGDVYACGTGDNVPTRASPSINPQGSSIS